ncbi:hypothetical protein BGZ46_002920, partial [Entomortierella lignicola]
MCSVDRRNKYIGQPEISEHIVVVMECSYNLEHLAKYIFAKDEVLSDQNKWLMDKIFHVVYAL